MQLAFASGRIQNPATTSTTKSLQCFNVLVRVNSAGSSTCSNCHFVQPKLMANHLLKGQKRILQADQADGLSGIKGKNHKGLKTLLISDGARCYPKLARKKSLLHRACSHSKGIFSRNKRLPTRGWTKIHTGNIDGFWKGAKKAIPDSLPSQKKEQTECQFVWRGAPDSTNGAGNARGKT